MTYLHETLLRMKEYKTMVEVLKESQQFKSAMKGCEVDFLNCLAFAYARGLQESINAQRDKAYRPQSLKTLDLIKSETPINEIS